MRRRRPSEVPEQQAALGGSRDHDVSLVQRQAEAGEDPLSAENAHGPGLHELGFAVVCFGFEGRDERVARSEERGSTRVLLFRVVFCAYVCPKCPLHRLFCFSALARFTKFLKGSRGVQRWAWVKAADK